ncbi:MAG: glycosyltransferase [Thermoflexales bacterium]|nr:glycosyltransferase [Thermoflexales bacterium]MCS7325317.1 glycosyltransferase [Thermoflexales bacterium]MCX7939551.1 glycosyltransferase [Thermoflexales bacterium]MDW8053619.1 glycosyltransferase [Anaerolineae bacterium]MDW8292091.1 glycosyltransferase [Anaerolineae bacterium]
MTALRIVHIYKDYAPVLGGIENHIRVLAEAQARRGHHVSVLVTQRAGLPFSDTVINGVRVVKVPRQLNVQSAPISFAFPRWVRLLTRNADIAHLHAPYPIGELCNLWFGRARHTVITWHSDIVRQRTLLRFYTPWLRRVIAHADRIFPTSEVYARTSPWLQRHLDKCRVIPLGVDPQRFAPPAHPPAPSGVLRLLSVGRLRYYKGLDDLIRALSTLHDAEAFIVGDGPMAAAWQALARQLGVADRVHFIGEVDDEALPRWYQNADVYVIPANARAEAFGVAILEAMASGLPVISTEVGTATSWINQHGVTGFVVPPRDPQALAAAIERLRDPRLRRQMGEAARARVLAEFTEAHMLACVEAAYRELTDASAVPRAAQSA